MTSGTWCRLRRWSHSWARRRWHSGVCGDWAFGGLECGPSTSHCVRLRDCFFAGNFSAVEEISLTGSILSGSCVFCFNALHIAGSVTNWYESSWAVFIGGAIGTGRVIEVTWEDGLPGVINGSRSASVCADPKSELLRSGSEDSNRLRHGVRGVVPGEEDVHAVVAAHALLAAVGVSANNSVAVGREEADVKVGSGRQGDRQIGGSGGNDGDELPVSDVQTNVSGARPCLARIEDLSAGEIFVGVANIVGSSAEVFHPIWFFWRLLSVIDKHLCHTELISSSRGDGNIVVIRFEHASVDTPHISLSRFKGFRRILGISRI